MSLRHITPAPTGFIDFCNQVKTKLRRINDDLEEINDKMNLTYMVSDANTLYHGRYVSFYLFYFLLRRF